MVLDVIYELIVSACMVYVINLVLIDLSWSDVPLVMSVYMLYAYMVQHLHTKYKINDYLYFLVYLKSYLYMYIYFFC